VSVIVGRRALDSAVMSAETPSNNPTIDAAGVEVLAGVVATLAGMKEHAPEWVHNGFVRLYREQLKALEGLGIDGRDWRISRTELAPFVYASDDAGNALSHSELEFIDRPTLFTRLDPALARARELLALNRASATEQPSIDAIMEKVERDMELRFSRREAHGNVIKLMGMLLRDLKGVEDRLGELPISARPRDRLGAWIRTIDEGMLTAADWTPMKDDLDELDEHIREKVDGHPHQDFYSLSSTQQHLVAAEGFISSVMHDIEILQCQDLQAGLDAFNATRRRSGAGQAPAATPTPAAAAEEIEPAVFIGHGHSPLWRELKDYIENDLNLRTVYFEQASHVGEHPAEFLQGFLAGTVCSVIVLTGDDEQADRRERARQNVVHETGLFQGRLGFKKVAMVIQDGVEEFSNVAGIVPIRFPDRHIKHAFGAAKMVEAGGPHLVGCSRQHVPRPSPSW
jgi:predicted nucleotide-binding protein